MTRHGKIARLPRSIREELNQRLQEGELGTQLVRWLNGLPKVRAVLRKEFKGQPIAENNLSAWKTGGYLNWQQAQTQRESLNAFMEKTASLEKAAKDVLTDRIALFFAVNMAHELNRLDTIRDGEAKARSWRELRLSLLALRKSDLEAERLRIERANQVQEEEPPKPRMTVEEKEAAMRQIMGTGDMDYDPNYIRPTPAPATPPAPVPQEPSEP